MRRAGLVALPLLALLSACATKTAPATPGETPAVLEEPADAPAQTVTYTCENGLKLEVTFEDTGNARVIAGTMAPMALRAMPAASGNYFTNGPYALHTKGMDEALWIVGRRLPLHCTAPAG